MQSFCLQEAQYLWNSPCNPCIDMDSDSDSDMDMQLKPCSTTALHDDVCYHNNSDCKRQILVDRLSNLPDELLSRILCWLPTKDAARTCFASKRLSRVFPFITTLDIDDLPISHCLHLPNKIHRFPSFVTFVDNVLQPHQSPYLTRFRLGVGSDVLTTDFYRCSKDCLPDVKPTHIHLWISFPLTCCGLKELDLRIHVREPSDGQHQLPPEIFTCETLEVLKLDVNLPVDRVSTFRLPLLKLLYLHVSHIYGDGSFVSRLVSCCPSLEDLMVEAIVKHVPSIVISSPSLRILDLQINTRERDNTPFLCLHTPNLKYLHYCSNLALHQSITNMDRLTKATILMCDLIKDEPEVSCEQILSIMRCLTNVHSLSLLNSCLQVLNVDVVKDQLPMFHNLKYLELGNDGYNYWDKVLEAFLTRSPVLETLVFPQEMIDNRVFEEKVQLEQKFCKRGLAIIPWCCRFHLKRIVINNCYGNKREIGLIQFLLKHALVLEELVLSQFKGLHPHFPIVDKVELQRTLQNLPRASITCAIQVL